MKIIGTLKPHLIWELYAWIEQEQIDRDETHSSYASNRHSRWYRTGSNLQSIRAGRDQVFAAPEPCSLLTKIGNKFLPGWNSLLVCTYKTSIGWHFDHGHFEADAVMVNLGEAIYSECARGDNDGYKPIKWGKQQLTDGMIVKLNIKLLHCAKQTSQQRHNFTFRRIKSEYL